MKHYFDSFNRLNHDARRASRLTSRSILAIGYEMLRLRLDIGRLGTSEYMDFRLFDDALSYDEKRCFLGRRGQEVFNELMCDEYSTFIAYDKLVQHLILTGLGCPVPELQALYVPESYRVAPRAKVIKSVEHWEDFLVKSARFPLYLKRCHGNFGRGNVEIDRYENERLVTSDGVRYSLPAFVESLSDNSTLGWLVQSVLKPHHEIVTAAGCGISGLRIYTVQTKSGPVIHRAVWKINVGGRITDHFSQGATGNMVGQLNLDTGVIERVVSGVGFEQSLDGRHPITACELVGFELPDWEETKELVLTASCAFPGFLAQGWDVALTDKGPVLLEVNIGNVSITQHCHGRGFLDQHYLRYLDELGIAGLLKGPSLRWLSHHGGARRGRRSQHWKWW
ncbi:sugar-transfer associated ATP-grasp domain-containing protein [Rhodocyclaceae bacterium SMB388]